jgi:transposase
VVGRISAGRCLASPEVVHTRFGVDYNLPVLLHRLRWSVQVPARAAAERDEKQITAWREETWPEIKGPRRTWAT